MLNKIFDKYRANKFGRVNSEELLTSYSVRPHCPVCNSLAKLWVDSSKVTLYRCVKCHHCFTGDQSIVEPELYDDDYYLKVHRNWFEHPNIPLFSRLAKRIFISKSKSVLDIGCGDGSFLKYLVAEVKGLETLGIDLSAIAKPVEGISFVKGDFFNYPFNRKFDTIVALAAIEHFKDVSAFVYKIHDLLDEKGTAYIMTINEGGVLYKFSCIMRKIGFPSVFIRLYDPHHINHFSVESLRLLLTRDNLFEVKEVINHNIPYASIDVPESYRVYESIMRLGVMALFLFGRIVNKTYLQTIVVSKV